MAQPLVIVSERLMVHQMGYQMDSQKVQKWVTELGRLRALQLVSVKA